jgi:hypothetical protein
MSGVTAFLEERIIARGPAAAVTRTLEEGWPGDLPSIRVFDDATGRAVDLDYWDAAAAAPPPPRGRGRPRLGVAAREVTLLPRHWQWLAAQPGGASAALRRLVEAAMKAPPSPAARRDAAYRFLAETCGDRLGYEEALRALYRGEREAFDARTAGWPADIRAYAADLLGA